MKNKYSKSDYTTIELSYLELEIIRRALQVAHNKIEEIPNKCLEDTYSVVLEHQNNCLSDKANK